MLRKEKPEGARRAPTVYMHGSTLALGYGPVVRSFPSDPVFL